MDRLFKTSNSNQFGKAEQYIRGLFQAKRSNIERMSEVVVNSDYYQIQHFISESPWDARGVMDEVALQSSELFSEFEDVYLLIDESAIPKKATKVLVLQGNTAASLVKWTIVRWLYMQRCLPVSITASLRQGFFRPNSGLPIKKDVSRPVFLKTTSGLKPSWSLRWK